MHRVVRGESGIKEGGKGDEKIYFMIDIQHVRGTRVEIVSYSPSDLIFRTEVILLY